MVANYWAFVWGAGSERPDAVICVSTLSHTRSGAWNNILEMWFSYNPKTKCYHRDISSISITRNTAIKFLKRRGGAVVKVVVEPA